MNGQSIAIGALSGGGTAGGDVDLGSGSLTVGGTNTNTAFDDRISGTGNLIKTDTGILVLSNTSTWSGTTTIADGRLVMNGSAANSALTVQDGGTLSGGGTVGAVTVASGGSVAPGNSIGTLKIDGDITFDAGSTYRIETDPAGNSDRIDATGQAAINGGTVDVLAAGGDYEARTDYTIVSADGSVTGAFDSATTNLAFLEPSLAYGANDVTLTLARNDLDYAGVANTPNQLRRRRGAGHERRRRPHHLRQPLRRAAHPQPHHGPHPAHALPRAAVRPPRRRHRDRHRRARQRPPRLRRPKLGERPGGQQRGLWVRAIGGTGDIDATANASGSGYASATLALGADARLAKGLTVGGGLDIDNYQLAWSLEGGRSWAWTQTTTVTPFLGLDFSQTEREGFTEHGAGAANLKVAEETSDSLRTRVGLRLAATRR